MTPDFIDSITHGDGTCRKCQAKVEPYKFAGKKYMPTVCPACLEEANREAELQASASIAVVRDDKGIKPRFEACTFDSYHPNGNARALDLCRLYADAFPPRDGSGLCLHGGFGTGKTHLAVSIARSVPGAFVTNTAELLAEIRKAFDGPPTDLFERCLTVPLLVLDDVGQQKDSVWVWEQLYILINRRYESLLPTIFTTNVRPEEWTFRWGGAVDSRIRGMSTILELKGVDYRTLKK